VKPFRFGLQATSTNTTEVVRSARKAEDAGFDVFQIGDHVGAAPSALVALAAAATATSRIRLGTLVLNNDLRHPVTLAQELVTLDHASGGRLEVGIGAGHSFTEYAVLGKTFDPPAVRKERFAEAVEILTALFAGGPVTFAGSHYRVDGATTAKPAQARMPLLIAVNGKAALSHAVQHADIVAPNMLGRTLDDGQHHAVRWEASRLDDTITWMQKQAGERWASLEIHALVQALVITDDRTRVATDIAARTAMNTSDILSTPFLCLGTREEIAVHLFACRERWGINYYTVRELEAFVPVMELLRAADARAIAVSNDRVSAARWPTSPCHDRRL
jgi:probable F420-dependent oxidoreductase